MARPLASALTDILVTIERIEIFTSGKTVADLSREPMLNDAVERCIERISEASRSIPEDIKSNYPAVPWPDIAAIGNRIRHGYFAVDPRIIWDTATLDLPALRETVLDIQRQHADGPAKAAPDNDERKR